ncbi:MAG: hypothetical protein J0M28_05175 [Thauera sp.]|nr:hypothetical protein [Thauera sp.]
MCALAAHAERLLAVEVVHLCEHRARVVEAERLGVKSIPALVIDGQPFHINFGAGLDALK